MQLVCQDAPPFFRGGHLARFTLMSGDRLLRSGSELGYLNDSMHGCRPLRGMKCGRRSEMATRRCSGGAWGDRGLQSGRSSGERDLSVCLSVVGFCM